MPATTTPLTGDALLVGVTDAMVRVAPALPPPHRGSRTEISPGARTHHNRPDHRAHSPPSRRMTITPEVDSGLRHR
jgi:hypothetical protein